MAYDAAVERPIPDEKYKVGDWEIGRGGECWVLERFEADGSQVWTKFDHVILVKGAR